MSGHLQHAGNGSVLADRGPVDFAHPILVQRPPNPTTLRPGSYIHLWAPGEDPRTDRPVLARVERATADTIIARDLGGDARGKYEVGADYPATLRWRWELAAPPERPLLTSGDAEVIDRAELPLAELTRLLFGEPGSTVRISTRAGESYTGVPTAMVTDGDQDAVVWVRVEGPTDSRGPISYMVRFADITAVIHGGGR